MTCVSALVRRAPDKEFDEDLPFLGVIVLTVCEELAYSIGSTDCNVNPGFSKLIRMLGQFDVFRE